MSKNKVIVLSSILILISGFLFTAYYKKDNIKKFFLINEEIHSEDKVYVMQNKNIVSKNLGKQIGLISKRYQIFEIEGLDSKDWICGLIDGQALVFKNKDLKHINLDEFKTTEIVVKKSSLITDVLNEVTDKEIIDSVLSYLVDENRVAPPENYTNVNQINLYSDKYPGLGIVLFFVNDDVNKYNFMMESSTQTYWKVDDSFVKLMFE